MGRELRRVAAGYEHPKAQMSWGYDYKPLFGRSYSKDVSEWDYEESKWLEGLCRDYAQEMKDYPGEFYTHDRDHMRWQKIDPKHEGWDYTSYAGNRPDSRDYMPDWSEEEKTHFCLYEDVSEGTPVSPVFATKEELARWLETNYAHSLGSLPSYEEWMAMFNSKHASSPSMVISNGQVMSGEKFVGEYELEKQRGEEHQ